MGHRSIQVTVDTYGHLIAGADISWMDRPDTTPQTDANPAQTPQTEEKDDATDTPQWIVPAEVTGGGGGTRTYDLRSRDRIAVPLEKSRNRRCDGRDLRPKNRHFALRRGLSPSHFRSRVRPCSTRNSKVISTQAGDVVSSSRLHWVKVLYHGQECPCSNCLQRFCWPAHAAEGGCAPQSS